MGPIAYARSLGEIQAEFTKKMEEYIRLCKEIPKVNQQIGSTTNQVSDLKTRIAALKEEQRQKREENPGASLGEDLAFDIHKLEKKLEGLEKKLAELQEKQKKLDKKLNQLHKELLNLIKELQEAELLDIEMWGWLKWLTGAADRSGATTGSATRAGGMAEGIKNIIDNAPDGSSAEVHKRGASGIVDYYTP